MGTQGARPHLATPSRLRELCAAGTRANRSLEKDLWVVES